MTGFYMKWVNNKRILKMPWRRPGVFVAKYEHIDNIW